MERSEEAEEIIELGMANQTHAVLQWTNDGDKLSTHHLKHIITPKKPLNNYAVGDTGVVSYPGFAGNWQFLILAVGESKSQMDRWLANHGHKRKNVIEDAEIAEPVQTKNRKTSAARSDPSTLPNIVTTLMEKHDGDLPDPNGNPVADAGEPIAKAFDTLPIDVPPQGESRNKMTSKAVKVITNLQTRNRDSEYGCSGVDAESKIWTLIVTDVSQALRGKMTAGTFVVLHNVTMTYKIIRVTNQSRIFITSREFVFDEAVVDAFLNAPVRSIPDALASPDRTRLSIRGLVTEMSPVKSSPTQTWRRRDVTVQDKATDKKIRLKLWGTQADLGVSESVVYTAKNVMTSMYNGTMSLNSTPETTLEVVETNQPQAATGNREEVVEIDGTDDTEAGRVTIISPTFELYDIPNETDGAELLATGRQVKLTIHSGKVIAVALAETD